MNILIYKTTCAWTELLAKRMATFQSTIIKLVRKVVVGLRLATNQSSLLNLHYWSCPPGVLKVVSWKHNWQLTKLLILWCCGHAWREVIIMFILRKIKFWKNRRGDFRCVENKLLIIGWILTKVDKTYWKRTYFICICVWEVDLDWPELILKINSILSFNFPRYGYWNIQWHFPNFSFFQNREFCFGLFNENEYYFEISYWWVIHHTNRICSSGTESLPWNL